MHWHALGLKKPGRLQDFVNGVECILLKLELPDEFIEHTATSADGSLSQMLESLSPTSRVAAGAQAARAVSRDLSYSHFCNRPYAERT